MLTTRIEDRQGIRLIHLAGPLNSETCDPFRGQMEPMLSTPGVRIVLDCEHLYFVSSRGLSVLAHCQQVADQNQAFFGIAALNKRIVKTIELLGMIQFVKQYPTVDEAIQAASTG